MSLWWLQAGWGDACCASCGQNIQRSGGDPDWGICWPCMKSKQDDANRYAEMEREYYEGQRAEYERSIGEQP